MNDLLTSLPPGALMMLAAIPLVLVPHHARQVVMLLAIVGSAFSLTAGAGQHLNIEMLGVDLLGGLNGVAAIHKQAGPLRGNGKKTAGARETRHHAEAIIMGGHIFILKGITEG